MYNDTPLTLILKLVSVAILAGLVTFVVVVQLMGTKTDPGLYNCLAAAEADEPLFILLARDPLAYHLVRIWAAVRSHDAATASVNFGLMITDMAAQRTRGVLPEDPDRALEAYSVARDMLAWRGARGERQRVERNATPLEEREARVIARHPIGEAAK